LRQLQLAIGSVLALSVMAGTAAHAQKAGGPPTEKLLNPPPDQRPHLTREQLKACMESASKLIATEARNNETNSTLLRDTQELQTRKDQIEKRVVDRSSRQAIDAYNAEIKLFNAANEKLAVSIEQFNAKLDADQLLIQAYNIDCAGLAFSKADEKALMAELGLSKNPMEQIRAPR
jgi:hypothetical protein